MPAYRRECVRVARKAPCEVFVCGVALGLCRRLKLVAVFVHRSLRAVSAIENPAANVLYQNRKRQAESASHLDLKILREQKLHGLSTSQKELPHAPVTVALKEGHAAWVIERGHLSAPGDEMEAETRDVTEERLRGFWIPAPKRASQRRGG